MVNMHSPVDDRTARARIRDEALRLFADEGADTVSLRAVAAAAGVSPALVVRHYGSKEGLREAVDHHVARTFETMLTQVSDRGGDGPFDTASLPTLTDLLAAHLPADSPVPAYLGRMLLDGGPAGSALFRRLHEVSREALARLVETGAADAGSDPDVRAAVLLVNDLAVLLLRGRLQEVLSVDPLSPAGLRRWGTELLPIYDHGLRDPTRRRT